MFIENINQVLTYLTLFSHLLIVLFLIALLNKKTSNFILSIIKTKGLLFVFLLSLLATMGSLFYSEIAGYDPCKLCWYQRIFIYPQVILLGIAYFKNEKTIVKYSLTMAIIGLTISIYHNYIYYRSIQSAFCGISIETSCTTRYIFELGYITIPLMALTALVYTIVVLAIYRKQ
ncbi:disulfide bond formation protein B [Candidatus Parcubacteria bacterium]|nr:MAG: disulfide bond formation protein B [Candidatus Parcubacteria bacterium]